MMNDHLIEKQCFECEEFFPKKSFPENTKSPYCIECYKIWGGKTHSQRRRMRALDSMGPTCTDCGFSKDDSWKNQPGYEKLYIIPKSSSPTFYSQVDRYKLAIEDPIRAKEHLEVICTKCRYLRSLNS